MTENKRGLFFFASISVSTSEQVDKDDIPMQKQCCAGVRWKNRAGAIGEGVSLNKAFPRVSRTAAKDRYAIPGIPRDARKV
jgi:hypothetical protein